MMLECCASSTDTDDDDATGHVCEMGRPNSVVRDQSVKGEKRERRVGGSAYIRCERVKKLMVKLESQKKRKGKNARHRGKSGQGGMGTDGIREQKCSHVDNGTTRTTN
jgi:hypothetical protein